MHICVVQSIQSPQSSSGTAGYNRSSRHDSGVECFGSAVRLARFTHGCCGKAQACVSIARPAMARSISCSMLSRGFTATAAALQVAVVQPAWQGAALSGCNEREFEWCEC